MNTEIFHFEPNHLEGENATHPIEPRCGALALLLLFAGISLRRLRVAPAPRIAAHSGASNEGI